MSGLVTEKSMSHTNHSPVYDLVMDHVEAHRSQRHPGHDVYRTEPNSRVRFVSHKGIRPWHHIPEPDGSEAHKAEIKAVQQRPTLHLVQREGAQTDVHEHDAQAQSYGRQDGPAVHGALGFVVGTAEAVRIFRWSVPARGVKGVAVAGVGSHVEGLLETWWQRYG